MALKSPKLRQKALDFSTQAGEIITRTLQESNLPRHAQNALESMLGKNLSQMLDSRKWINDPKQAINTLQKQAQELLEKEQQQIYGVVYKGEHSATIYKDLAKIDEAILLQKGDKKKGGTHIRLEHTQDTSQIGYVTPDEVANLGQNARKYINEFGEPYNDGTGKLYEWQENGANFRLVVRDISGGNESLPSANEDIITFYSNRNLQNNKKEWFKNPKVSEKYNEAQKVDLLPKLQKVYKHDFLGRLIDKLENFNQGYDLPERVKNRIYNTYIKKDSSLKGNDFRIDGDDIYVGAKISPEAMNEAINELLITPTILKDAVFKATQAKYKNFSDKKIQALLDFTKESHEFTKDKKGIPKEFYHGSDYSKFETFQNDNSGYGFFFSTVQDEAKTYIKDGGQLYKTFLSMKKPFIAKDIKINSYDDFAKVMKDLGLKSNKQDYKDFLENKRFFNEITQRAHEHGYKVSEMKANHICLITPKKEAIYGNIFYDTTYPFIPKMFEGIEPISKGADFYSFGNYARNELDLAILANSENVGEYNQSITLKDILQKQGYDGIIFNDFQVSVFNPNQIKAVSNKGSWTDGAGNITKDKPKDKDATHSYFNEKSPNIYHSNAHIGAGLLTGGIAGTERDENGNIVGFNPQNFALGFASGAGLSKSLQFLAKKAQSNPRAKALLERIQGKHALSPNAYKAQNLATISPENIHTRQGENMENPTLIQAFGINYAEFSGQGIKAFNYLSQVKNGFVEGAFFRQDIGDIDLVWGKVWQGQNGNIQGYGLSKIKKKHPEITAKKLNDIITNGEVTMRKNEATQIFYKGHKVLLKQNWNGESLKNKWIVTAYAKV